MDIMELGAIGEFVSGIVVIGSLIFVGLQVRGAAQEQRVASMRESTHEIASVMQFITGNETMSGIWLKGMADFEALDATERLRFSGSIGHFCRLVEQLFYQSKTGTVEHEVWRGFERQLADYVAYPGFRAWWPTRAAWYGDQFREFVESRIATPARPSLGYGEETSGRP